MKTFADMARAVASIQRPAGVTERQFCGWLVWSARRTLQGKGLSDLDDTKRAEAIGMAQVISDEYGHLFDAFGELIESRAGGPEGLA